MGEPEDQTELRKKLAFYQLNTEILLLQKRSEEHKKKTQTCDDEFLTLVKNYTSNKEVIDIILSDWDSCIKNDEVTCIKDWKVKGKLLTEKNMQFIDESLRYDPNNDSGNDSELFITDDNIIQNQSSSPFLDGKNA
jgi:hypothetical protein